MTQQERLLFLLRALLAERREYADVPLPDSLPEQRRLLRGLIRALYEQEEISEAVYRTLLEQVR